MSPLRIVLFVVLMAASAALGQTPPTIAWVGPSGRNWNNPTNWNPARVPLGTDYVSINAPTNVTVTLDVSPNIASLTLGADSGSVTQRLLLNPGVGLTLATNSVVGARGELVLPNNDGCFLSGTGVLEVRGLLDWTAGRLYGKVSVAAGGRAVLRGGSYMRLSSGAGATPAVFTNAGTVTWMGGVQLYAYDNSQIYNLGRWELAADGDGIDFCCSGVGSTFYNLGTLVKTAGTNATSLNSLSLINDGTVEADSGTLTLASTVGSAWHDGSQIAGAGRVRLSGGSATLSGRTTLNGQWEWSADGLNVYGTGEVGGPVPLNWTSGRVWGALTVAADGVVNLLGGAYMRLSSGANTNPAALTNYGLIVWAGGDRFLAYDGAQVQNFGEWRIGADGTAFEQCCSGDWPIFYNHGLLTKTAGTNSSFFGNSTTINSGTIAVATGTLQFNANTQWPDGALITGSGSVRLSGGSATLSGTTTLNASWLWDNANIYGAGAITGPVPLQWLRGRVWNGLTVSAGSRLILGGAYYPLLASGDDTHPAMLTNWGTVSWVGNTLYASSSSQIYNFGQWRLEADGTVLDFTGGGGWCSFLNQGTLTKTAGTNSNVFANSTMITPGLINVAAGTIQFTANTQWPDGAQITGTGRVLLSGGTATLGGAITLNASWQWDNANIYGMGTIAGPVPLQWLRGRVWNGLTVSAGSRLILGGAYYPLLTSGDDTHPALLTNWGTVSWVGNPLYASSSAQIYNFGQWRLEADGTVLDYTGGGGWPSFLNQGTLIKTVGTNSNVFANSTTINPGVINVGGGAIQFTANTQWPDGGQITGTGHVLLSGGTATLSGTTTLNARWQWDNTSIYGAGTIAGPGPLEWLRGRLWNALTISAGSRLNLGGGNYPFLASGDDTHPAVLTNRGTVAWAGYPLYAGSSSQIYNFNQWRVEAGGTALDFTGGGGWGTFYNLGTLTKPGLYSSVFGTVNILNSGRITAEAGQMALPNSLQNSGELFFSLSGPNGGTDFGVIRVNGVYALQGTLRVETNNGFALAQGQTFDLVTGTALGGNFPSQVLPALPPDSGWTVDYAPTVARLRVTDSCFSGGLISWWSADSGAADLTGAHNGALVNGATTTNGFIGQAFFLDGVNDYVDLGAWSPGTRTSLQAWVNLSQIQAGRHGILGGINQNLDWALTATGGYLGLTYCPLGGGSATLTNPTPALTNTWYHLAGTCNGSNVAFYLNGVLVGTATSAPDYVPTATGLRIGAASYAVAENLAGSVDEATIHNRPLTASEIAGTFANGAAGRCAQFGLGVLAFTPSGFVTSNVTQLQVRFNQPFRTNTFTGADVAITGPAGVVPNATFTVQPATPFDGRAFVVNVPTLTNEGPYAVTIGPDIQNLAGVPMTNGGYVASFTIDKTGPRVIAFAPTSPLSNQVTFLEATFNEAISGATVQPADVTITGPGSPTVISVVQTASNAFRFLLSQPFGQGAQTITIGPAITDLAGNPMNQNGDATNGAPGLDAFTVLLEVETPDLIPLALNNPALALAGQGIGLTYSITNAGTAPAPGGWQAQFWMAQDTMGTGPVFLGAVVVTNVLTAQSSLIFTQELVLPQGVAGVRYLGVGLDALGQIVESNKTNNFAWAAQGLAVSAADLTVTNLGVPASATLGSSINIGWTRKNIGSAATFVAGQDQIFLSTSANSVVGARLLASVPGSILGAGVGVTLQQSVTIPLETGLPPGNYFVLVAVDSPNAQPESNETNNLAAAAITLNLPPLPDLALADFSPPPQLTPGAAMDVSWVVTNVGSLGLTNVVWQERLSFTNATIGRVVLAEFEFTNTLPAGGFLARTQTVVYPDSLPALPGWLLVTLDPYDVVVELSEANNVGWSDLPLQVALGLRLSFSADTITEGGAAVQASVRRNGDTSAPLLVIFTNNQPARLGMTNQLVIPAGADSATFSISLPDNGHVDGTVLSQIGANATNYEGDVGLLKLVDLSTPALTLTLLTNQVLKGSAVPAMVDCGSPAPQDLVVFIGTSDPLSLTVPFSVTIPSNQTSTAFGLLANTDSYINGTHTNVIQASATGYANSFATLLILDANLPTVTLEISPALVVESAGLQAANLTARLSGPAPQNVVLDLVSSAPDKARVQGTLSIPAGQVAASAPVAVVDDLQVGPLPSVQFQGFVHQTGSTRQVAATEPVTLSIVGSQGLALSVKLDHDVVDKGLTPATTGTVTRNGNPAAALVVTLASSAPTQATLPASVIIPAGQTSAPFSVNSVQDNIANGSQRVTLTASATGFSPATVALTVTDNNLPDLRVVSVTGPSSGPAGTAFTLAYRVENQGRVACGSNLLTKIYLRADPLAFGGTVVASYALPPPLPPGQFFEQSLQGFLPSKVGTYYLVAQTDADAQFTETLEDNNTLVSAPIQVTASWAATVQAGVHAAPAGIVISMTGSAARAGGQPVANVLVSVHVKHNGTRRDIAAFTDANGNFATTFTPFASEAGFYEIAASDPSVDDLPAQDTFTCPACPSRRLRRSST